MGHGAAPCGCSFTQNVPDPHGALGDDGVSSSRPELP